MALREIALIWASSGVEPKTSTTDNRDACGSIEEAFEKARQPHPDGLLPWLRAGSGHGAAIFNVQGIAILEAVYEQGYLKGQDDAERPKALR